MLNFGRVYAGLSHFPTIVTHQDDIALLGLGMSKKNIGAVYPIESNWATKKNLIIFH